MRTYTLEMDRGTKKVEVPDGAVVSSQHHPGGTGGTLSVEFRVEGDSLTGGEFLARFFGVKAVYREDVTVVDNPTPRPQPVRL